MLSPYISALAVLDADRVFVIQRDVPVAGSVELRVIAIPGELPSDEVDFQPEVLWSRPRGADESYFRGAGFGWTEMAIADTGSRSGRTRSTAVLCSSSSPPRPTPTSVPAPSQALACRRRVTTTSYGCISALYRWRVRGYRGQPRERSGRLHGTPVDA